MVELMEIEGAGSKRSLGTRPAHIDSKANKPNSQHTDKVSATICAAGTTSGHKALPASTSKGRHARNARGCCSSDGIGGASPLMRLRWRSKSSARHCQERLSPNVHAPIVPLLALTTPVKYMGSKTVASLDHPCAARVAATYLASAKSFARWEANPTRPQLPPRMIAWLRDP